MNSPIVCSLRSAVCTQKHVTIADSEAMETTREKATYENHNRGWDGDGAIRIPDEALQELSVTPYT